jgi:hypothetical protein
MASRDAGWTASLPTEGVISARSPAQRSRSRVALTRARSANEASSSRRRGFRLARAVEAAGHGEGGFHLRVQQDRGHHLVGAHQSSMMLGSGLVNNELEEG